MAVNYMNNFGENSAYYFYVLAAVVTFTALALSSLYLFRRLLNIRTTDKTSNELKIKTDDNCRLDDLGNDGDNTVTADQKEDTSNKETSDGQFLSTRYADPVEYCEHIQGEFKRVQQSVATRTIKKSLTEQQLEEEKEVQRRQLGEIFRLMQEQQERFGIGSIDDMQEQMKLYAL